MQLQARLVHAEPGTRVVEVSAHQQGRRLASALGEAASAEAAEDRAIERLSQRLGAALSSEPWPAPEALEKAPRPKSKTGNRAAPANSSPAAPVTGAPAAPGPSSPAAPVSSSSAASSSAALNSPAAPANSPLTTAPSASGSAGEPTPKQAPEALGNRRQVIRSAAGSTSSEPAAESGPAAEAGPDAATYFSGDSAIEKPGAEEPAADPEDWSGELAQLELELKRLGWQREQESSYLERAFGHPSRSRLTTYADLLAYLQALAGLEPGSDPANAAIPLRRKDLLLQCDQLMSQLNWDAGKGREYLEQQFNLNSRQQLSDSQLLHFNMLLESEWLNRES